MLINYSALLYSLFDFQFISDSTEGKSRTPKHNEIGTIRLRDGDERTRITKTGSIDIEPTISFENTRISYDP